MNDRAHPELSPPRLSSALAHTGLARFAAMRLARTDAQSDAQNDGEDLALLLGLEQDDWLNACKTLATLAPGLPGPIGRLLRDFRLQLHEWFVLALVGEIEASPRLALAVAALQAPERNPRPGLALIGELCAALFGIPLTPLQLKQHALVRAGILNLEGDAPLSLRALAMSPALWAVFCGDRTPWPEHRPLDPGQAEQLPQSLREQFPRLEDLLRNGQAQTVAFRGGARGASLAAAQLAGRLGLRAVEMSLEQWQTDPALSAACRYAGWLPVLLPRLGAGEQLSLHAAAPLPTPLVLVLGREGAVDSPALVEVEIPRLTLVERRQVWQASLGDTMPPDGADHALLDGPAIVSLSERARLDAGRLNQPLDSSHLARARGQLGAEQLRLLAQPVTQRVEADALILPPAVQTQFDDLVTRCRRREQLWDSLGITLRATLNPGVRALFVGDSGTGKTLAAARLATRLNTPLYRVDLAAVMNKYVGESEKNLGLVLDEAAASDVILLLDEADALFGRRSDGGENGERFANMLTNFLLTRIESHPGIVILTSNSRNRIDPAFTRRLDAIVEFPAPGGDERLRLWQAHLGARSPGEEVCRLLAAYCELAGGHIRNAVLNAAARDCRPPETMLEPGLLLAALIDEYRKLGRDVPPQLKNIGRRS